MYMCLYAFCLHEANLPVNGLMQHMLLKMFVKVQHFQNAPIFTSAWMNEMHKVT